MRRILLALVMVAAGLVVATPAAAHSGAIPHTVELDGKQLAVARLLLRSGHADATLRAAFESLKAEADTDLTAGPWSVVNKTEVPPSGDKHDYLSEAPYWWPTQPQTADNPYGCPYVQRDGQTYPGSQAIQDHNARGAAFNAIYDLTLAWYYTGKAAYAERAELDLRTWFLDPATRMNPSLNYTQFIPCLVDGRGTGIIDFSEALPDVIDAAAVLDSGAPGWHRADRTGITGWFDQFLTWLQTSPLAADEKATLNNHGSFFDEQEAALALYVGQPERARDIVRSAEHSRIDVQIASDGSQPLELSRTRSWHYSIFNLMALTRLASVAHHVGIDLWGYAGGSLTRAVDFLLPAATQGEAAWPYQELSFHAYAAIDVIHAAADAGDRSAVHAVTAVPAPPGGDLWPVRPAAEDLG
jgi:alginate lyase